MMNEYVMALSANAGISLTIGNKRIWIDALHDTKVPSFSTVSQELANEMRVNSFFSEPDIICFTHCHDDHFSEKLTALMSNCWKKTIIIIPESRIINQILLEKDEEKYLVGDIAIKFIRLTHGGKNLDSIMHYGIMINHKDNIIMFAGDTAIAGDDISKVVEETKVDIAVLNFTWVTSKKGQEFVINVLRPKVLLIVHLPFAQDDIYGYIEKTNKAISTIRTAGIDTRVMCNYLQVERIELKT